MSTHSHHVHRHAGSLPQKAAGISVLRMSAGRRLAIAAGPIALLWLLVALTTDVWA